MQKYMRFFGLIILTSLLTLFSGCSLSTMSTTKAGNNNDLLIVFANLNLIVSYYQYSVDKNENNLLVQMDMSGYPTAISSNDGKTLYYTARDSNNSMQLYKMDLASNNNQQLTNLDNVDYLRLDNKRALLFMRVIQGDHHNFQMATYNIKTGTVTIWNPNEYDLSVQDFDYDPNTEKVTTICFSDNERYQKTKKANLNHSEVEPLIYQIIQYSINGNNKQLICNIEKYLFNISTLNGDKDALLNIADDPLGANCSIYKLDLQLKTLTLVFSGSGAYTAIKMPNYSADGKGIYFLAMKSDTKSLTDKNGASAIPRFLYYYDLKTHNISQVWVMDNGTINNYVMLR